MTTLNERVNEVLETIPNVGTSPSPIVLFEAWLGMNDLSGPLIEDETPPVAFFQSFASLLVWAYHVPFTPMQEEKDFEELEALRVTKWLQYCLDLRVSEEHSFLGLLLCLLGNSDEGGNESSVSSTAFINALYHHVNQLSQLQMTQNVYSQSLRKSMASKWEEFNLIQASTQRLQEQLDAHIGRLELILGECYSVSSVEQRSLTRKLLATYWHIFVVSSSGVAGVAFHENTKASGVSMTLKVLLRILKGMGDRKPSHRHLLFHSLIPLHQPSSLVLWRDQTALLDLYHEPLVQCIAVLLRKDPSWISPTMEALLNTPIWTPSNTPKLVLLLHEIEVLWKLLPEGQPPQIWPSLLDKLTLCMASDNSRLAECALQFFRSDAFKDSFHQNLETSLPLLLKAVVKSELPWNPTVRKMTYHVLKDLHQYNAAVFAQACQDSFCGRSPVIRKQPDSKVMEDTETPIVPSLNKRASKPKDFSLKAGMGNWRPPKRNHNTNNQMPPPPSRTPPSTVTGVAPWANNTGGIGRGKAPWSPRNQPPLTVTGVAPWAISQTTTKKNDILRETHQTDEAVSEETQKYPALARVLKYMEDIKPQDEREGASPWSKEQMAETPTLLPSLKFHDLVFGHELGSGAFGSVRYARLIDQSKTRSHWAEYAVKVISTQRIAEMGYEASVQREIATLRLLSHPGIARLISSFRFRDGAYLVLEYASRGDLHMLLRNTGSLDHESTEFVIGEVVAALSSIHELGFVYGDLKAENMVITEPGHIKLTDFGGCRPFTEQAKVLIRESSKNLLNFLRDGDWKSTFNDKGGESNITVSDWTGSDEKAEDKGTEIFKIDEDYRVEGTTAYLPPEVVLGSIPTPAADMWALGCVLYHCLTGRPPLLEDDDEATRQRIVTFDHSSDTRDGLFGEDHAKDVQADARDLISKLLSRSMTDRPTIGQVAVDNFFRGKDVFVLHRQAAHPLDVGKVNPVGDSKWSRRQLSSIWAPQPKAYDISVSDESASSTRRDFITSPISEGQEASSFFSYSKRSGPLHHVKEHTKS